MKNKKNSDKWYTTPFIAMLVLILFLAVFCKYAEVRANSRYDITDFERVVHIVKTGETAWDYAEEYCPGNMNKWEYLEMCARENGMDGMMGQIYSGRSYIFLELKEKV